MVVGRPRASRSDFGSVLVITLMLTVILAVVVLALARYVTTGLRTSDTATVRTDTNFDASNVMNWAIEEFSKKNLRPEDCGEAPAYVELNGFSSDLTTNGSTTKLECAQTLPSAEPVVHLIATSVSDQTRVVEATLTVPRYAPGARVSDWRVDIPIDVLPYSTTPTIATTSTTAVPNSIPTASPTAVSINPSTTSTHSVFASDSDGTITTVSFVGVIPSNLQLNSLGGLSFEVVADATIGTFSVSFQVQDDHGGLSPIETLTVEVTTAATTTTAAPTTTTTLAPNPACTFTVTSAAGDEKSGIANLAISNTGGAFTGWQVVVNWPGSWSGSWDPSVTASLPSPNVTVSGSQSVGASTTLNFSATLTWKNGNPKINVSDTRTCTVVSP